LEKMKMFVGIADALPQYSRFKPKASPASFLSGDADKREVKISFEGKKEDDLGGSVKRRFVSDLNRWFWEHPKDVDDTRLVFEASEAGSKYSEKGGKCRLVLKLSVELATNHPKTCCC
jgi:hypothetical protein